MLEPTRDEVKAERAHAEGIECLEGLIHRVRVEDTNARTNAARVGADYKIQSFFNRLNNVRFDGSSLTHECLARDSYVVHCWCSGGEAAGSVREVILVHPMLAPQSSRHADESFNEGDLPLVTEDPGYAPFGRVDCYSRYGGSDSDCRAFLTIHKYAHVNEDWIVLAFKDERFAAAWRHIIDDVRAMHTQLDAIVEMERRRREAFVAENDKHIDTFLQKQLQERLGLR